jgi:transketolase
MTTMTTVEAAAYDCRVPFAETLIELAGADPRIVAVCNDSVGSSNLLEFERQFPDRMVNVGIAEQNMVGVAAGLANAGFIPFVCAAAPFLTGRAMEQIKADVVYSRANVKLCGMSPGVSYGELGPTHHSIEDIAWLRALDGLPVVVPADPDQTRAVMRWAAQVDGGVFLRIGRYKVPSVSPEGGEAFVPGSARVLREGRDVTLIASGTMVSRALWAADLLAERGIEARVLNMSTIVPLDEAAILRAARETGGIVTVEESVPRGGLGGAVAETVVQGHPVPMRLMGIDRFAPTGSVEFLFEYFGLTAQGIAAMAADVAAHAS